MQERIRVHTFDDAVAEAFALAEQFKRAHTAILTDVSGNIRDMTVYAAPHHTPDTALDWAQCVVFNDERITRMVLLSVVTEGVREPCEDDIQRFNAARAVFGRQGCQVLDHLLCDGEKMRSLAFTTGAGTWDPEGAPAEPAPN